MQGAGTGNPYNTGVTGNGVTAGRLTFAVPTNAPNRLFYNCQFHSAMTGIINLVDAPAPPVVRIVSISVGTSVVVRSTGTNGSVPVPEYKCNLTDPGWTALTTFTNSFANGTNTTAFDPLEAVGGSGVFLRIRQNAN